MQSLQIRQGVLGVHVGVREPGADVRRGVPAEDAARQGRHDPRLPRLRTRIQPAQVLRARDRRGGRQARHHGPPQ